MRPRPAVYRIVYHCPCNDGGFAALAAHLYQQAMKRNDMPIEIVWTPCRPGKDLSAFLEAQLDSFKDQAVHFLDIAASPETTLKICQVARHVRVLDHHESALALFTKNKTKHDKLVIDDAKDQSGASMALAHFARELARFLKNKRVDGLVELTGQKGDCSLMRMYANVEDADLFRWEFPDSKAFHRGLMSLGIDWDANSNPKLFEQLLALQWHDVVATGKSMPEKEEAKLAELEKTSFDLEIRYGEESTFHVQAVETNDFSLISTLGARLAAKAKTGVGAVVSSEQKDQVKISLRGKAALELAQRFEGGGGHAQACGFTVSKETYDGWWKAPPNEAGKK